MKKKVELDGFVDVGTVKVGGRMEFLQDGKWYKSSPIVACTVHGGNVYAETKNTIYTTFKEKNKVTEENVRNLYNITYEKNNVPQTINVSAHNKMEAESYFLFKKPNVKILGVDTRNVEYKPGKPTMYVPDDWENSIANIEHKDIGFHM